MAKLHRSVLCMHYVHTEVQFPQSMERHAVADAVPGKAGQGQGPGEEVGRPGSRRPTSLSSTTRSFLGFRV